MALITAGEASGAMLTLKPPGSTMVTAEGAAAGARPTSCVHHPGQKRHQRRRRRQIAAPSVELARAHVSLARDLRHLGAGTERRRHQLQPLLITQTRRRCTPVITLT